VKQCILIVLSALSAIAQVPSKFHIISTHREGRIIYYNAQETKQIYANFKAQCTISGDSCRFIRINLDTKEAFAEGLESFAVQKDKNNPNVMEIERNIPGCSYKYLLNFKTKRFMGGFFYCKYNVVEGIIVTFTTEKGKIEF
jgi:hypothetical protein